MAVRLLIGKLPLRALAAVRCAISVRRVEPIHIVRLIMHRLLLEFNLHLLFELDRLRLVLRLVARHHLIDRVLVYQLLLDLVGAWIVFIFILAEGKSTLPDGRVLHVGLGGHEANRSLLLLLHAHIVRCHQLLRVDNRENTVLSFLHRHNH